MAIPTPTSFTYIDNPLPTPTHHLGRRHYFLCGDRTLSWEQEWYTAPFFLSSRSSYDRAASTGVVQPPLDVYRTVGACQRELGITVESTITTTTNGDGVAIWTTQTSVITTSSSSSSSTSGSTSASSSTSTSSTSSTSTPPSSDTSATSTSISSEISVDRTSTFYPSSTSSSASFTPLSSASALPAHSTNTCTGDWDWQAWGMLSNLLFGLLVGALLWATWAILRPRMPGFYSPRTWFVPTDFRPSRPWGSLAFLFPFTHMPPLSSSIPLSASALAQRNIFTCLKLAAASLIALAGVLPVIVAGVPCLKETSPRNELGGRTGSLTDLSLLRLLNALDPSPDSATTNSFIQVLLNMHRRDLPSTVAPAISSARHRLIVLLVLLAVLIVILGLFPLIRSYSALAKYRKHFNETICGGMSMVFMDTKHAGAWRGKTEEGIKAWLRERTGGEEQEGEVKELDVIGVFAIPDTYALREKIRQREVALDKLEVAEARYIQAGRSVPTPLTLERPEPDSKSSKATAADIPELVFHSPTSPTGPQSPTAGPAATSQVPNTEDTGTRFVEINRDSGQFGRRFKIGQRIKVDEQGVYVPDPSPTSSDEGHRFSHEGILSATTISSREDTIPEDSAVPSSQDQTPQSEVVPVVERAPTPVLPTSPVQEPPRPSASQSERHDPSIERYRSQFKVLNEEISVLQQDTFAKVSNADPVLGWILVGRGVEWLPGAQVIEGLTREDIQWANLGRPRGEKAYLVQVAIVGFVFFVISVPFLALTVATAPGFANYLPFLRPVSESDGFWTGVVEALVPAFVLSHLLMVVVLACHRLSKRIRCISGVHRRALAFKATFWLLLLIATLLPLTIVALEFAVQGFATDVQRARTVGDGAAYSTWFAFVVLLNMAIILPGLLLVQPLRLLRHLVKRRSAVTPRRKFKRRLPPTFYPSIALAPALIAVFYAVSLLGIFPLLAIPLLLMLYLSFIVVHHQAEYLYAPSTGYEAATLALWTTRRLAWVLAVQPLIFGLILLIRNEWTLGGISIGLSALTLVIAELMTARRHPAPTRRSLMPKTRKALNDIARSISRSPTEAGSRSRPNSQASSSLLRPRQSTSSMLRRLTALLPGLSRLPPDCPLPLQTHSIDDLQSAEQASYTRPDLVLADDKEQSWPADLGQRGLLYPPEMTAEVPIIWLTRGKVGLSGIELNDLASNHGLEAIIDPPKRERNCDRDDPSRTAVRPRTGSGSGSRRNGQGEEQTEAEREVRSPLISPP